MKLRYEAELNRDDEWESNDVPHREDGPQYVSAIYPTQDYELGGVLIYKQKLKRMKKK